MNKKYKNYEPKDIARVARRKSIKYLVEFVIVSLASLCWHTVAVFTDSDSIMNEYGFGVTLVVIFVGFFITLIRASAVYIPVQNILMEDCDPQRFIDVEDELSKHFMFRNIKRSHRFLLAIAYMDQERYDEAWQVLDEFVSHKDDAYKRLSTANLKASICFKTGRYEEFAAYAQDVKDVYGTGKFIKPQLKLVTGYIRDLEAMKAEIDQDYEKAAGIYKSRVEEYKGRRNTIVINNSLARTMDKAGDNAMALVYYEKILAIGEDAKMAIIAKAKARYAELTELMNKKTQEQ